MYFEVLRRQIDDIEHGTIRTRMCENDGVGEAGRCRDLGLGEFDILRLGRTASTLVLDMMEFIVATETRELWARLVAVDSSLL